MDHRLPNRRPSICRTLALVILAGILPALLYAGAAARPSPARTQPILLQMAGETPDATVGVIVQKTVQDTRVEELVYGLGGQVTEDLSIINAFAAEVRAKDVPAIASTEGVRWVSLDAPVVKSGGNTKCTACISTTNLKSTYVTDINADKVWNEGPGYFQGQGITIAVVDSGINGSKDLQVGGKSSIIASYKANTVTRYASDGYGHGTFIAGVIAGNGQSSNGTYMGIAPKARLLNVKVSDDNGGGTSSDVVKGLQWVYDNRLKYNIRVVNISLNSAVMQSYHQDPIDAAAEILWFNGMVVVASAGNTGTLNQNALYPPANDPFVITVGAVNDQGTAATGDDAMAAWSASGLTPEGFAKPDLVAPATNIISLLASKNSVIARQHPDHIVRTPYGDFFRMSGTSMAAPMVSGAAALLIQSNPKLNPDQVKYRLMATARPFQPGSGAGYLDVYAAVHGSTTNAANTGVRASALLSTGNTSVLWNSVNWNSVNWNSVNWNSVNWNSVNWNSVHWGP